MTPPINPESKLAVVMPTKDRAAVLQESVVHLFDVLPPSVEIVIVANGSSDGTGRAMADLARDHPQVRFVETPTAGTSAARNLGVRSTDAEILVFIDDDIRPTPGWIDTIVAPIIAKHADAVVGAVELEGSARHELPAHIRAMYVSTADAMEPAHPFFTGCNSAITRAAFTSVNGFDEELGPGATGAREDIFLGMKLAAEGLRMVFEPRATVIHAVPGERLDRPSLLERAERDGRSEGWISYHWGHADTTNLRLKHVAARALEVAASVRSRTQPFPTQREIGFRSKRAKFEQLMTEKSRPRKYTLRSTVEPLDAGAPNPAAEI